MKVFTVLVIPSAKCFQHFTLENERYGTKNSHGLRLYMKKEQARVSHSKEAKFKL